jgi:hypothetical protein
VIECQARFRAIPVTELIDDMTITIADRPKLALISTGYGQQPEGSAVIPHN